MGEEDARVRFSLSVLQTSSPRATDAPQFLGLSNWKCPGWHYLHSLVPLTHTYECMASVPEREHTIIAQVERETYWQEKATRVRLKERDRENGEPSAMSAFPFGTRRCSPISSFLSPGLSATLLCFISAFFLLHFIKNVAKSRTHL